MNSPQNKIINEEFRFEKQVSYLSLFVLLIAVFVLQIILKEITEWVAPEGNLLKLFTIIRLVLSIIIPVIVFLKIMKLPAHHYLILNRPPLFKTILAVVMGFILIIVINLALPNLIKPSQKLINTSTSIAGYGNVIEFILSFVTVAVFASISDEFFFRGVLLKSLMQRHGKIAAVLITAGLTASFHTFEPFKLVHAFSMGLIFAFSVVWTNSVYTSIILHGLHNCLALLPQG